MGLVSNDLMKNRPRRTEIRRGPSAPSADRFCRETRAAERSLVKLRLCRARLRFFRLTQSTRIHVSCTNLVGHGSHAWKTCGAHCRRMSQYFISCCEKFDAVEPPSRNLRLRGQLGQLSYNLKVRFPSSHPNERSPQSRRTRRARERHTAGPSRHSSLRLAARTHGRHCRGTTHDPFAIRV